MLNNSKLTEEEAILQRMVYYAIFTPPGTPLPNQDIVMQPMLKRYYSGWGRPGDFALFVNQKGTTVGACWVRLFSAQAPGYGFVDAETPELSIAVIPGYRGLGIGTRLLNNLLTWIKPEVQKVSLSVSCDNPAVKLYRRAGFTLYKQDDANLIMVKSLQNPRKSSP